MLNFFLKAGEWFTDAVSILVTKKMYYIFYLDVQFLMVDAYLTQTCLIKTTNTIME